MISLAVPKIERKQNDQISIRIHMDQRKLIFHQVASTEQGRFKTLPSSVGCDKVSLTELLPPSADLTELGWETKDYRVR